MAEPQVDDAMLAAVKDIRAMLDEFLRETMTDDDMVAASEDLRRGYDKGFREATAVMIALMFKRIRGGA